MGISEYKRRLMAGWLAVFKLSQHEEGEAKRQAAFERTEIGMACFEE